MGKAWCGREEDMMEQNKRQLILGYMYGKLYIVSFVISNNSHLVSDCRLMNPKSPSFNEIRRKNILFALYCILMVIVYRLNL